MQPLPFDKRVAGQRVKWYTDTQTRGQIEYTGVIVPLPDDHPLKAQMEVSHELVYVMPDRDKFPWLQAFPFAYWDFMIEGGCGNSSPLYEE